jgi:hypothetical protein
MQSIFRAYGDERVREAVIGANSEVFKDGTLVSKNSGGFLIVATAGLRIWGVSRSELTMASDNQTVAKVAPVVVEHTNLTLSMLGDQAVVAGDRFKWADISTVSAGLQTVAVSTASTSGQLAIQNLQTDVDTNPNIAAFQLLVRVAEWQDLAYAQV